MKKFIVFTISLIAIIFLSGLLRVNVPVSVSYDSNTKLSLNGNKYKFALTSQKSFSSISLRLLSNNKPLEGKIDIKIIDISDKILSQRNLSGIFVNHGDFYTIKTNKITPRKRLFLEISGSKDANYTIHYNGLGKDLQESKNGLMNGSPVYRLSDEITLKKVVFDASDRASRDWFRFGPLYLLSIILYVLIISFLLGLLLTRTWIEDKN